MFYLMPSMGVKWGTDSLLKAAVDPAAAQGAFYGPRFLLIGARMLSNSQDLPGLRTLFACGKSQRN